MPIYAVRISVLCIIEGGIPDDGYTQDIQVHIIEALDDETAFSTSLAIGKSEEHEYKNDSGGLVRWVFKEIESITNLGDSVLGKEVSSRMEGYYPKQPLEISANFSPETSETKIMYESDI